MIYQKPEVVLNGTAISAIEAGFNKPFDQADADPTRSSGAYISDES